MFSETILSHSLFYFWIELQGTWFLLEGKCLMVRWSCGSILGTWIGELKELCCLIMSKLVLKGFLNMPGF
jgi:hypothetical protein